MTSGPALMALAEGYLAPIKAAGVDTLVLGCTHYPLLTGAISYVMGENVTLVSSAEETAKDVYRTLVAHDLLRTSDQTPTLRFQATFVCGTDTLQEELHRVLTCAYDPNDKQVTPQGPAQGETTLLNKVLGARGCQRRAARVEHPPRFSQRQERQK